MTRRLFAAAICSLGLAVGLGRTSFAGVVMAETSTATAPDGQTNSQTKTIYLQGNKRKVERQDIAAITDLDKSIIYIIDKHHHEYAEMPLQKLGASLGDSGRGRPVTLNNTGNVRVVANHPCREYRASEGDKLERVTISACVSSDVPGAREVAQFDQKMIAQLEGHDSQPKADSPAHTVMLEKESIVSFRIPDPSHHRLYRTASLSARTRVNQIQVKPLPPETFTPPKGFSQFRSHKPEVAPPSLPGITRGPIQVVGRGAFTRTRPANL